MFRILELEDQCEAEKEKADKCAENYDDLLKKLERIMENKNIQISREAHNNYVRFYENVRGARVSFKTDARIPLSLTISGQYGENRL